MWLMHPHVPVVQKTDGFLYKMIIENLKIEPLIFSVITYVLLFTQAITFNKLINDQKLMQRANYLPAMSYLLITSIFKEWNLLSAPLLVNTLLIWVWAKMSELYSNKNPKTSLYNIGMIIGVSTFFYFPSLAFALLMIFALIVTRPFVLAEWIIAFLGILTPYYFLFAYLFLSNKLNGYRIPEFQLSVPGFYQNYWELAAIILVGISFFTGLYFVQLNFRKQLVQIRKSWSLILLYSIVAVFVPFINATHTFEYWILAALPVSAYIGCAFLYPVKRWVPVTLHWLIAALAIIISLR